MILNQLEKLEEIRVFREGKFYSSIEIVELEDYTLKFKLEILEDYIYRGATYLQPEEYNTTKLEINVDDIIVIDWRGHRANITYKQYQKIEIEIRDKLIY